MDVSVNTVFSTVAVIDEFTLVVARDRTVHYDTLFYKGIEIASVEARIVEAQFRLPDGSTLLLLNDDEMFKEKLTLLLVSAGLKELDRLVLGGAFTPGYLTYAYPIGHDEVAFCWHELDQVVAVRRYRPRFAFRSRWLWVRELDILSPRQILAGRSKPTILARLRPSRRARKG